MLSRSAVPLLRSAARSTLPRTASIAPRIQSRGYAEAVSDKLKLSFILPHDVRRILSLSLTTTPTPTTTTSIHNQSFLKSLSQLSTHSSLYLLYSPSLSFSLRRPFTILKMSLKSTFPLPMVTWVSCQPTYLQ